MSRYIQSRSRLGLTLLAFASCLGSTGCVITDIGVSNPVPEIRRVAIAPFINLTPEPDVDLGRRALFGGGYVDRRFAQAYLAELQKTPGFEVIPVGVVDQAIAASGRSMSAPADYIAIAEMIGADAIVVGAVTDFDPYHPRLGLQVQWFSPYGVSPPAPTMPYEREWENELYRVPKEERQRRLRRRERGDCETGDCEQIDTVARAQSPDLIDVATAQPLPDPGPTAWSPGESLTAPPASEPPAQIATALPAPQHVTRAVEVDPLYSYTRFFDGRDARLTARLRDYVELSGDTRSGGWEGYLERSDDFIRFACHVSINEMLMLHGGESSRRTVFTLRKELFRKL